MHQARIIRKFISPFFKGMHSERDYLVKFVFLRYFWTNKFSTNDNYKFWTMPETKISCTNPTCKSENVIFSKKRGGYFCEECEQEVIIEKAVERMNIFINFNCKMASAWRYSVISIVTVRKNWNLLIIHFSRNARYFDRSKDKRTMNQISKSDLSREVRVFISSTFRDMDSDRNYLVKIFFRNYVNVVVCVALSSLSWICAGALLKKKKKKPNKLYLLGFVCVKLTLSVLL